MNIVDMARTACRNYPDRIALIDERGQYTFKEFASLNNRIANACLAENLSFGSRVAMVSPNCNMAAIAMHGAMTSGMIWCNLNLKSSPTEIIDVLARGECDMLFYHSVAAEMIPVIRQMVPSIKRLVCLDAEDPNGVFIDHWIESHSDQDPELRYPDDEIAFQGATGGTTGQPKLALNTNRWLSTAALGFNAVFQYEEPPVNLAVAPISHAGGVVLSANLTMGGTSVLMGLPDLEKILENIEKFKISMLFLPPTAIYMLLGHPSLKNYDYSSLKYLMSAAAPMSPEKIREAIKVFGPVVCQSWGQTEAGIPLTFMSPEQTAEAAEDSSKAHRLMSCGQQSVIAENLQVMDDEGNLLPAGEKGEMVVRGAQTMTAFKDDPKSTAEAQAFGWHHTGDIGYMDEDGYFYICDRKRDMVISGGFNIFPFEVEKVLFEHPDILECAVIGIPDEKWGEAVKAIVQLRDGTTFDEAEMISFCKERLGSMKAPKSIEVWDELPHSAVGKVLKREIREKFWKDQDRAVR